MNKPHQLLELHHAGDMVRHTGYPVMIVVVIAETPMAVLTTVWVKVELKIFCCMTRQRK
jgi:hypothetical protein